MTARDAYPYVGPKGIAERARPDFVLVGSPGDVRDWMRRTGQRGDAGCVVATFVIDLEGRLRLADRHSEHVACAEGRPVRSAGEMALVADPDGVRAVWISNQSIGYCPEPSSWPAVAAALASAGIPGPDSFDPALEFRRCTGCGALNIAKDAEPECGACGVSLPKTWNLEAGPDARGWPTVAGNP